MTPIPQANEGAAIDAGREPRHLHGPEDALPGRIRELAPTKVAAGGHLVLYHGTHHEDVPSIVASGLRPSGTGSGWTVTDSRDGAAIHAEKKDWTAPRVVEFHVPRDQAGDHLGEPTAATEGTVYALRGSPLPAEWVHQVHEVTPTWARQGSAGPAYRTVAARRDEDGDEMGSAPEEYAHQEESPGRHKFSALGGWGNELAYAEVYEKPDHVWLHKLYVHPDDRGRGTAGQLLENVIGHFPGRDIRLHPHPSPEGWEGEDQLGPDTDVLRGFYGRHGFEDYHPQPCDEPRADEYMVRHASWAGAAVDLPALADRTPTQLPAGPAAAGLTFTGKPRTRPRGATAARPTSGKPQHADPVKGATPR